MNRGCAGRKLIRVKLAGLEGYLFGHHWDYELHTIIWVCTGGREPAAKLQIAPKQWPCRPVKYKAHATHRALDPYLDETLKVGGAIKIENA